MSPKIGYKRGVRRFLHVVSLVALGFTPSLQALDPQRHVTQYVHDAWQAREGLPQSYVAAMAQTADGYLWLGLETGLARFDGVRFTLFDPSNTPELANPSVTSLAVARDGALWIGTYGGGVVRYAQGRFRKFTQSDGVAGNIVWSLQAAPDGSVWIGTQTGLSRAVGDHISRVAPDARWSSFYVVSLAAEAQGVWVGTEGAGLHWTQADGAGAQRDAFEGDYVGAVKRMRDGSVWVGSYRTGLHRYRDGRWMHYGAADGLNSQAISALLEDRDGNLWVGTFNAGLYRFRDARFERFGTVQGLTSDHVISLFEDREGNVWAGTFRGLNRLRNGKFLPLSTAQGLASDVAQCFYADRAGAYWVCTDSALDRYQNGTVRHYTRRDALAADDTRFVLETTDGTLWIATAGMNSLNALRKGRMETYDARSGLGNVRVITMAEDARGTLWAGTTGGLRYLTDGRFVERSEVGAMAVRALLPSRDGALWIGTEGGGLFRLNGTQLTRYSTQNGLPDDMALALHEDASGALWVGTQNGHLCRIANGRVGCLSHAEGLFRDVIQTIHEDSLGYFWMGGENGIYRVGRKQLELRLVSSKAALTYDTFTTRDGLRNSTTRGHHQQRGYWTADGRLAFATIGGVEFIDPLRIETNPVVPPVHIENVVVDAHSLAATNGMRLGPGRGDIEIDYSAPSFRVPEGVRFRYKLEGVDADWVQAGTRRVAYYTHLRPGHYVFRVTACNEDGVWNERGATLAFQLLPRWYQTYWAYTGYVLLVLALALFAYRVREHQLKERLKAIFAERQRIAREIHDTLAQGFVAIGLQLESVEETLRDAPDVAHRHVNRARELVRSSLAEARRSVWNLRAEALESESLAGALSASLDNIAAAPGLARHFHVTGTNRRLPATVEHCLLRVAQEAVTNAVRHANAANIWVELHFDLDAVRLTVRDDGRGFTVEPSSPTGHGGFGLISMRDRMAQLNGELSIDSAPGRGTLVGARVALAGLEHSLEWK